MIICRGGDGYNMLYNYEGSRIRERRKSGRKYDERIGGF